MSIVLYKICIEILGIISRVNVFDFSRKFGELAGTKGPFTLTRCYDASNGKNRPLYQVREMRQKLNNAAIALC